MQPLAIIKSLDVFEDRGAGLSTSDERFGSALGFEGGKETFFHGIVIAIAAPAHADGHLMLGEQLAVIVTGILTAAIRMVQ